MAIADLPKAIEIAGTIAITETTNEARLSCAQSAGVARVQWSSLLEANTCPLCAALDGKVFRVDEVEFNPPAHINCNCIWVERGDDEVGPIDWFLLGEPGSAQEQEWITLIGKHGHFLHDEEKYKPLRIPAGPTGRDFTFRRRRNPETGQLESVIEWKRPRYDLGDLTVGGQYTPPTQIGVTEIGERWRPVGGDVGQLAIGGEPPGPLSSRPYLSSPPRDLPLPDEPELRAMRGMQAELHDADEAYEQLRATGHNTAEARARVSRAESALRDAQKARFEALGRQLEAPAARTVHEAEQWARDHLALRVNYDGVTVEEANRINRRLALAWNDHQPAVGVLRDLGNQPGLGSEGRARDLKFRFDIDLIRTAPARAAEKSATLPIGRGLPRLRVIDPSLEGIIDHETGEVIDELRGGQAERALRAAYSNLTTQERLDFGERFSQYGLDEPDELFTEALVLWRRRPEELPAGWADIISGFVRRGT